MVLYFVAFHFGSDGFALHTQALRLKQSRLQIVRPRGTRKPTHSRDTHGNVPLGVPQKNQKNMARPTDRLHRSASTAKENTTARSFISGGDALMGRLNFEDGVVPT